MVKNKIVVKEKEKGVEKKWRAGRKGKEKERKKKRERNNKIVEYNKKGK